MKRGWLCLICIITLNCALVEAAKPIRKLSYDADAPVVDLLGKDAKGKLQIRVIPQNEFLSRILIENITDHSLTVRLPKAVAAVHSIPQNDPPPRTRVPQPKKEDPVVEETEIGNGQAVVGSFGPMTGPPDTFPHQSDEGNAFTIPAGASVQIRLYSACAEHGKRSPISRMTYELKPLDQHVENKTLQKIIETYDPQTMDSLVLQAAVWHLANEMSWEALAGKTIKRGGQVVPYFTRRQLLEAQKLVADNEESPNSK